MPDPTRFIRTLGVCALAAALLAACSPIGLVASAAGVATDTSMTWDIVKHLHGKLTEDDAPPCMLLNSVQRALSPRCTYAEGSIRPADLARSGLQECVLVAATRDPRLWRALPELLDKGERADRCPGSPLVALAESNACPDFAAASPQVRTALITLAETDPRAVRHDVFRMFGCPKARAAGLDRVLYTWLDRGDLEPSKLSFSPLGAADPDMLVSRFGHELEVAGHRPETALDGYEGTLPGGFEEALRGSHWAALDWWLYRLPQLANKAPPSRGGQLDWVPLQRVLVPGFLRHQETQAEMVAFLMQHGADPKRKLPFDPDKTVVGFATQMKSPMLALLERPASQPSLPAPGSSEGASPAAAALGVVAPPPLRQAARIDNRAAGGYGAISTR